MNAVICKKGSNVILQVVKNCVYTKGMLIGDIKIGGINHNKFSIFWTNDTINKTNGGFDKTLDQLTLETDGIETCNVTYEDLKVAVLTRKLVTNMTYQELEAYINTNVNTLAEAKVFLIRLAKVVLALSKIIDFK